MRGGSMPVNIRNGKISMIIDVYVDESDIIIHEEHLNNLSARRWSMPSWIFQVFDEYIPPTPVPPQPELEEFSSDVREILPSILKERIHNLRGYGTRHDLPVAILRLLKIWQDELCRQFIEENYPDEVNIPDGEISNIKITEIMSISNTMRDLICKVDHAFPIMMDILDVDYDNLPYDQFEDDTEIIMEGGG
jgi:hypothetical protein